MVLPHHTGLLHPGVTPHHRLDLPKLNAKPPHLDLMVNAPQELEIAIGQVAD